MSRINLTVAAGQAVSTSDLRVKSITITTAAAVGVLTLHYVSKADGTTSTFVLTCPATTSFVWPSGRGALEDQEIFGGPVTADLTGTGALAYVSY